MQGDVVVCGHFDWLDLGEIHNTPDAGVFLRRLRLRRLVQLGLQLLARLRPGLFIILAFHLLYAPRRGGLVAKVLGC
ncbi:hypothetical protein HPB51_016199 [Rhipicephalus microplus]|uniref:Uncharacterized protein n=1 Tax=Rhipicephalus microplus TaxID=6941 RepID=A0A9J6E2X6_RHIMP|nr:hypothetical protein HPB51_016199 [Rhipicephalus microplus]